MISQGTASHSELSKSHRKFDGTLRFTSVCCTPILIEFLSFSHQTFPSADWLGHTDYVICLPLLCPDKLGNHSSMNFFVYKIQCIHSHFLAWHTCFEMFRVTGSSQTNISDIVLCVVLLYFDISYIKNNLSNNKRFPSYPCCSSSIKF